jgi:hypothetical protein
MRRASIAGIMPVRKRSPAKGSGMGKEETRVRRKRRYPAVQLRQGESED